MLWEMIEEVLVCCSIIVIVVLHCCLRCSCCCWYCCYDGEICYDGEVFYLMIVLLENLIVRVIVVEEKYIYCCCWICYITIVPRYLLFCCSYWFYCYIVLFREIWWSCSGRLCSDVVYYAIGDVLMKWCMMILLVFVVEYVTWYIWSYHLLIWWWLLLLLCLIWSTWCVHYSMLICCVLVDDHCVILCYRVKLWYLWRKCCCWRTVIYIADVIGDKLFDTFWWRYVERVRYSGSHLFSCCAQYSGGRWYYLWSIGIALMKKVLREMCSDGTDIHWWFYLMYDDYIYYDVETHCRKFVITRDTICCLEVLKRWCCCWPWRYYSLRWWCIGEIRYIAFGVVVDTGDCSLFVVVMLLYLWNLLIFSTVVDAVFWWWCYTVMMMFVMLFNSWCCLLIFLVYCCCRLTIIFLVYILRY